jgi:hypothetical protein
MFFVGSDSFALALIASTYILRLGNIEVLSQQLKHFPKFQGQSCAVVHPLKLL